MRARPTSSVILGCRRKSLLGLKLLNSATGPKSNFGSSGATPGANSNPETISGAIPAGDVKYLRASLRNIKMAWFITEALNATLGPS